METKITGAGVGKRLGAYLLDYLLIFLIYMAVAVVIGLFAGEDLMVAVMVPEYASSSSAYRLVALALPIVSFLYGTLQEMGTKSATVGKRVAKLVVTGECGGKPRSLDIVVRNIMKNAPQLVTALFMNVEALVMIASIYDIVACIVVVASKNHRGIHDFVANTTVTLRDTAESFNAKGADDVKIDIPFPAFASSNQQGGANESAYNPYGSEKTVAPTMKKTLLAISGQYNDAQFPLDMPIVMGREAGRCNIVFATDTKGVSKVHCEIKSENGRVYLTDLGSTYGTLVNGEKQLRANETVELQMGDRFRIGKNETFMVK